MIAQMCITYGTLWVLEFTDMVCYYKVAHSLYKRSDKLTKACLVRWDPCSKHNLLITESSQYGYLWQEPV